jgi:hypothetical protein
MLSYSQKIWRRVRGLFPLTGFHFDRPIVLFQSDDWGRVGLRDHEGFEQLRSSGLALGERPYDFYTLETGEDLAALSALLNTHRDSSGGHPCLGMNFLVSNLHFAKMRAENFHRIHLLPLAEGLPEGWNRPGLQAAYRQGIADGVFRPALHGTAHFCLSAVGRNFAAGGERAALLRTLWQAGTPYIHWRMPWIGYEYWDPEKAEEERMLPEEAQKALIGEAVGGFAKMFSSLPRSACAPGYRADDVTHRAWAQHGIRAAQNGPGTQIPPHVDRFEILQLSRNVAFEPATDAAFSVEACLRRAESAFALAIPAIISLHSINFHSTVRDFRSRTLQRLEEFLTALESKHADLLYLHDDGLYELVTKGFCQRPEGTVKANVTRKSFSKREMARSEAPGEDPREARREA